MKHNHKRNLTCFSACCVLLAGAMTIQPAWAAVGSKRDELFYTARSSLIVSADSAKTESLDLSISQEFAITRPTEALTTTYSNYYITGTSDPSKKLSVNGTEITRPGTLGTWGYYATLEMGANTFTFKQGDETKTVTITRKAESGTARITDITQGSMLPAVHAGVKVGNSLEVSCIAPSGGTVKATFGGRTVTLKQVATANTGIPALFKGEIEVSGDSYDADTTQKVGPVSYELTYNGSTKTYESSGDVYVAGANSNLAVRVTTFTGFVYPDTSRLSQFKELLKKDATDYVRGQDNSYIELRSGGHIPVEQVEFIEGTVRIGNTLSGVSTNNRTKYESYAFAGTSAPAYDVVQTDTTLQLTLYNTTGEATPSVADSKLFSSVSRSTDSGSLVYTFKLKENATVWGYGVTFSEGTTTFTVRYKPTLSSNESTPFTGLTVLIDPGHGGSDPGAAGVAGANGPDEATLNLAHAYAVRDELVKKGATVYLTRDSDAYSSLDDRLEGIEACDADLYISLHHNSVGVNTNAGQPNGAEVYYHTSYSRYFANCMLTNVTSATGRTKRSVIQSYYRVTLLPQCPSLLVELGFLSNPAEYEKMTQESQINLVAKGISNGILVTLR